MSIKMKKFNTGDYVEISAKNIWDADLPADGRRDGLVVEVVGKKRDQIVVMFHTGKFLKFHKNQLKILEKLRHDDYNKNID